MTWQCYTLVYGIFIFLVVFCVTQKCFICTFMCNGYIVIEMNTTAQTVLRVAVVLYYQ